MVYAVAPDDKGSAAGGEMITLGAGQQWTYTTGSNTSILEGTGINMNWASGDHTSFQINSGGGATFITGFGATDSLSLTDALAGLNLNPI